jgi:hypothetical protein
MDDPVLFSGYLPNFFDPTRVLKSDAILVRQWRGHTHTFLVREDGFV